MENEMLKSALDEAMEYIAELKLENAELKEKMKITSEWWVNRYYAVDKAKLQHRINKAIEYIKNNFEDDEGIICKKIDEYTCDANYNFLDDLLNILQNGSDSQC